MSIAKLKRALVTLFFESVPPRYQSALLRELRKRELEIAKPVYHKLDYPKHEIYVHQGIRANSCQREPETVRWVENYIKPGQVLFDIGANIGAYSLIAAKYHQGTVKVYAFEPAFQTFPLLVKNILKNDCGKVIFPLNMPLGEVQTLSAFNYKSLKEGKSGHAFGDPVDYRGEVYSPVFSQLALATTIDRLVQEYNLPKPNHIKLDVDGLEFQILKGAKTTISGEGFESLLVEVGDRFDLNELSSFLQACGLQLSEVYKHPETFNYIFKRRAKEL